MLADLRGRPVLEHLVRRLDRARRPDLMVLATTEEPADDRLADAAACLGLTVFRGAREDVLVRWREAAIANQADLIVNCDGDDVFCDPAYVDRIIEEHARSGAEYITCRGLPFGAAPTGIARSALERVCAAKRETNTEGQGRFFQEPGVVSRAEIVAAPELGHPDARMTLDYPEDLAFFDAVLAEFEPADEPPSLLEIVRLLQRRPDLVAINAGLQEQYWERFNALYKPVTLKPQ